MRQFTKDAHGAWHVDRCKMWIVIRDGQVISAWPTKAQAEMATRFERDDVIQGTITTNILL